MKPMVHHIDTARSAALLVLPVLGLLLVVGLVVASDLALLLLGFLAVVTIVPLSYFAGRQFSDQNGWLLLVGWLLMLVSNGVQVATHVPVGYLQELLLFGLGLGIAGQLWQQSGRDRTLRVLIFIYIAYLVFCFLSTLTGRSHMLPAIWQLQYNLKWPLMFGLGCLVVWGASPTHQLRRIIQYSWLFLLACVALEIAAPGVHTQVFGPTSDLHQNPILGFGLRYRGPFMHSGYLAITSALLAAAALAQVLAGRSRAWAILGLIYLALLLLSGQRQELLALVLTMVVFVAIQGWQYWYLLLGLAVMSLLLGITVLVYLDYIPMATTLAQLGILNSTAPLSERAILSLQGIAVANQYWPLGSGLGTYGGAGAQKFDQSLFLDLGFSRYWWFRQGLFLVDTFWPGVIAEAGFLGAALLLLVFVILWVALVHRTLRSRGTPLFAASLTALAALTLMLANSPSSGVIADPRGSFLFWILIGVIWQATGPAANTALQAVINAKYKESRHAR